MRAAFLADNSVTDTRDQAGTPDTGTPAPVSSGYGPGVTRALPRPGARLRRIAGLLRRVPKARASYYDPMFERPDLIEDDYYRLRNQPHG